MGDASSYKELTDRLLASQEEELRQRAADRKAKIKPKTNISGLPVEEGQTVLPRKQADLGEPVGWNPEELFIGAKRTDFNLSKQKGGR